MTVVTDLSNPGGSFAPGARNLPLGKKGEQIAEEYLGFKLFGKAGSLLKKIPGVSAAVGGARIAASAVATRPLMFGGPAAIVGTAAYALAHPAAAGAGEQTLSQMRIRDLRRAQEIWGTRGDRVTKVTDYHAQEVNGKVDIAMTLTVKHPDGTTTRPRVHVSPVTWKNNSHPTRAGKPGARR